MGLDKHVDVDLLAGHIAKWGYMGRHMPPAWDGAEIAHPVAGWTGDIVGSILPGKGFYLNMDLKSLGITKPLPNVFERTCIRRAAERAARAKNAVHILRADERGAIASYNDIIANNASGNGLHPFVQKSSFTTVANQWSATWQAGGNPSAGAYSGTPGTNPDNTTAGALSQAISEPSGANVQNLLSFGYTSSSALNMVWLVDLLAQVGSLSATSNASQTVSSSALTRNYGTTGAGVQMTFDITSALGGTASNLTVTYTNQAGTGSRTTPAVAMLQSGILQRLTPVALGPSMQLEATDFGIQTVASLQLSASMTGSGVFALNLWYPILLIPGIVANITGTLDTTQQISGLWPLIKGSGTNVGCLTMYCQTNTTTSGVILGSMQTVQG